MKTLQLLIVAFSLVMPALAQSLEDPPKLQGEWEGIVEMPRRPVVVRVALAPTDDGWSGTIDVPGATGLPLADVRFAQGEVHFVLRAGDEVYVFDGTLAGDELSGRVSFEGQGIGFSLGRVVPLPEPQSREEAWQQDLDVVLERFLKYDLSFSESSRARSRRSIEKLRRSVGDLNDPEIIVELSRAIALSGNAHTRLYLLRNRNSLRRYPIRVYWFGDELYIVKATDEHADVLGCQISKIGDVDPLVAKRTVGELFAGNDAWISYKSTYFLTSPEILFGTGLIDDMSKLTVKLTCAGGESKTAVLEPLDTPPLADRETKTEAWWDLTPLHKDALPSWRHVLDRADLPLYLTRPDQRYWFEYLEEEKLLYFQYNRSMQMESGPRFEESMDEMLRFAKTRPVGKVVLDLRFNTGGNGGIARNAIEKLAERFSKSDQLFVIMGRSTFSAGISHVAQLKQNSRAAFVGESCGDVLDTWSEGGNIDLPNSMLTVHYANGFHGYSKIDYPSRRPYFYELDVDDLDPDVSVTLSWEDYVAGRDPSLEAILGGAQAER